MSEYIGIPLSTLNEIIRSCEEKEYSKSDVIRNATKINMPSVYMVKNVHNSKYRYIDAVPGIYMFRNGREFMRNGYIK